MRSDIIKLDPREGETEGDWVEATLSGFLGGVQVGIVGTVDGITDDAKPSGIVISNYRENIVQIGFQHGGDVHWIFVREGERFWFGADAYEKKLFVRYQAQKKGFLQLIQFTREQFAQS